MEDYVIIKATDLPSTANLEGVVLYGVEVASDKSVKVPASLFQALIAAAASKASVALAVAGDALIEAENANSALPAKIESREFSSVDYPKIK